MMVWVFSSVKSECKRRKVELESFDVETNLHLNN